jgi:hypothetical protein
MMCEFEYPAWTDTKLYEQEQLRGAFLWISLSKEKKHQNIFIRTNGVLLILNSKDWCKPKFQSIFCNPFFSYTFVHVFAVHTVENKFIPRTCVLHKKFKNKNRKTWVGPPQNNCEGCTMTWGSLVLLCGSAPFS